MKKKTIGVMCGFIIIPPLVGILTYLLAMATVALGLIHEPLPRPQATAINFAELLSSVPYILFWSYLIVIIPGLPLAGLLKLFGVLSKKSYLFLGGLLGTIFPLLAVADSGWNPAFLVLLCIGICCGVFGGKLFWIVRSWFSESRAKDDGV